MTRYPRYKRVTSAITLALAAVWLGYLLLWPNTNATASGGVPVGGAAPDFELKTVTGESYRLSDLKGKAVLLNFFATWCRYCEEEMPVLEEAHRLYADQGLVVLGIDLDETDLAITAFQEELELTFPILVDRGSNVARLYQIVPLPTTYFIDRDGVVRGKWTGAITRDQLREALELIL